MSLLGKIGKLLGQHPEAAATTGKVARERLTVILASQRGSELLQDVDMQALQRDVLEVVRKHISIAKDGPIQMNLNYEGEVSLFEMSVELDNDSLKRKTG